MNFFLHFSAIKHCTFVKNKVNDSTASVVFIFRATVRLSEHNYLTHNKGSLDFVYSDVSLSGSTQLSNNYGGAIVSVASAIIVVEEQSSILISENRATDGGGIYLMQTTLKALETGHVIITKNMVEKSGGGIYAFQSTLNFDSKTDVKIMHNVAGKDGGGIYLSESQIEISSKSTIILHNTAHNFGVGIFLESTSNIQVRVKDAPKKHFLRFIRNSAQRGGGVYVEDNDQPLCREGRGKELSKPCFLQTFILHKKTPFYLIVF